MRGTTGTAREAYGSEKGGENWEKRTAYRAKQKDNHPRLADEKALISARPRRCAATQGHVTAVSTA